jgi:membrane protease YdiL (CAAX protease family)
MSDSQQPWSGSPSPWNDSPPHRSDPQQPLVIPPDLGSGEITQPMSQPFAAPPERNPFWGYSDLLLFIGLAPVCLMLGYAVIRLPLSFFHIHPAVVVEEALPEQLLGYVFLFGMLLLLFRMVYNRPFWASLGWTSMRLPAILVAFAGVLTAFVVVIASNLVNLPDTPNQMTELMQTRTAVLLMAIFGTTIAPLCEELAFRGFLQPLLVRSLGAVWGILLAAIPFGLLHYQEYGNSWRHALIISGAGAAFGVIRQFTGSTKAAVLMHASYNAFFFIAMLSDRKDLPQTW